MIKRRQLFLSSMVLGFSLLSSVSEGHSASKSIVSMTKDEQRETLQQKRKELKQQLDQVDKDIFAITSGHFLPLGEEESAEDNVERVKSHFGFGENPPLFTVNNFIDAVLLAGAEHRVFNASSLIRGVNGQVLPHHYSEDALLLGAIINDKSQSFPILTYSGSHKLKISIDQSDIYGGDHQNDIRETLEKLKKSIGSKPMKREEYTTSIGYSYEDETIKIRFDLAFIK